MGEVGQCILLGFFVPFRHRIFHGIGHPMGLRLLEWQPAHLAFSQRWGRGP